jgi:hypothetical protein
MKERPILFNGDMVRAILEGRKTQTRRPIKPQPEMIPDVDADYTGRCVQVGWDYDLPPVSKCPFGQPGDRLWVRETWLKADDIKYYYKANATVASEGVREAYGYKWRPSIHMPREASRITLEIDEIRAERVNDITEDDAMAEGIAFDEIEKRYKPFSLLSTQNARTGFKVIWDFIYSAQGLGSETNPWVWVVKFHRVEVQE